MSSSYCSSCKIEVPNDDNLRDHYKSEFHRYNIKRKLVGLPPVTDDQFSKKKAQLIAESSQSEKDVLYKCELCSKSFASKATYKQHLESNKHRENLKKFNKGGAVGADGAAPEFKEQQEGTQKTALEDQTVCLFCNQKNPDLNENLLHMRLAHSFFISEFSHLKNLKGLLKHLAFKIHKKRTCIYCAEDCKTSEGIQQHMIDKGHVFMNTEDFGEYLTFYDFSKKIENLRQHGLLVESDEEVGSGVDLLEIVLENRDEEERENDDDEDYEPEEDNQSWEIIDNPDGTEPRKVYRMRAAKLLPTGEVQLPNGTILGHRKLKTAYKQYYRDLARQAEVNQGELENVSENVLAARQEETRLAAMKETAERKQRNFVESQAHQLFLRREREDLKLKMRTNIIQPYFRKQQSQ
jgi:pre-60S factor REI1